MKILLLNPPFIEKFSRTSKSRVGGCVYYPIWLAYAAGELEKNMKFYCLMHLEKI